MVEILKNIVVVKEQKISSTNVAKLFSCRHRSVKRDTEEVKLHCKYFLFAISFALLLVVGHENVCWLEQEKISLLSQ